MAERQCNSKYVLFCSLLVSFNSMTNMEIPAKALVRHNVSVHLPRVEIRYKPNNGWIILISDTYDPARMELITTKLGTGPGPRVTRYWDKLEDAVSYLESIGINDNWKKSSG